MGQINHLHTLALSSLLAVAALAAVASAQVQVQCGTLGSFPISGCTTCEEATFNATFGDGDGDMGFQGDFNGSSADGMHTAWAGHGGPGRFPGGRDRRLLHGRPGDFGRHSAPGPMPNCTVCDSSANYVLAVGPAGPWHGRRGGFEHGMRGPGRCVCADGFGAISTGPVNVTIGNKTLTLDQFTCATCPSGEVPLTHKSGLFPLYNSTTQSWSLVLNTTMTDRRPWNSSRTEARMQDSNTTTGPTLEINFEGKHKHAGEPFSGSEESGPRGEPAVRPPWTPGQCVTCPSASAPTSDGVTCVAA